MLPDEIIHRLREAVKTARQPHYGDTDTKLDHLHDGLVMVEELLAELETD